MEHSETSVLIEKVGRLGRALNLVAANLASLKLAVRKRSIYVGIAIVLDVLLTAGLGISLSTSHSAQNTANNSVATQVASCQSTNDARKNTRDFWDNTVIPAIEPANPTSAQVEAAKAFQVKVDATYAPRDCSAIK